MRETFTPDQLINAANIILEHIPVACDCFPCAQQRQIAAMLVYAAELVLACSDPALQPVGCEGEARHGGPMTPFDVLDCASPFHPGCKKCEVKSDLHVLPLGDLREHAETRECWCGPRVTQEPGEAALIVHHSADGRELVEEHGVN